MSRFRRDYAVSLPKLPKQQVFDHRTLSAVQHILEQCATHLRKRHVFVEQSQVEQQVKCKNRVTACIFDELGKLFAVVIPVFSHLIDRNIEFLDVKQRLSHVLQCVLFDAIVPAYQRQNIGNDPACDIHTSGISDLAAENSPVVPANIGVQLLPLRLKHLHTFGDVRKVKLV